MELHLIALCALAIAFEPANRWWKLLKNWNDRRMIHKAHVAKLESEQ